MYDAMSARLLLGCFIIKPPLILEDKYKLTKDDFSAQVFHLRLFQAITALAKRGANRITAIECYNLCGNHIEVKKIFDNNN